MVSMLQRVSATTHPLPSANETAAVDEINRRCGVFTRPDVVISILDAVEWTADENLISSRLLEPSAGDGRFVAEAARRLVARIRRMGVAPTRDLLADRIVAYEIHAATAASARANVAAVLRSCGVHHATAKALALDWIETGDFLLSSDTTTFTHVVGNPPYIRWSKIPVSLKNAYDRALPPEMTGGDLFLPFLDRALARLDEGGRCGFLCSDRWRFMAFGTAFRAKWLPRLKIESEVTVLAREAFDREVGAYPSILVARKSRAERISAPATRRMRTLADAGYVVRVGPALGCTGAFVLAAGEEGVEPELLRPFLGGDEIADGRISSRERRIVVMHDDEGRLIDPADFPLLLARLKRHKKSLEARSVVRDRSIWYRPIDRVRAKDWARPKLLVPELAMTPRIALDTSGAIPSHGVYAIFAPDDDLRSLEALLAGGGLARALDGIAPKVHGGYVRCYRRFLLEMPIEQPEVASGLEP